MDNKKGNLQKETQKDLINIIKIKNFSSKNKRNDISSKILSLIILFILVIFILLYIIILVYLSLPIQEKIFTQKK